MITRQLIRNGMPIRRVHPPTGAAYSTNPSTPAPAQRTARPPQQQVTSELLAKIQRQAEAIDLARANAPPISPSPKAKAADSAFLLATLGLIVATPGIVWLYWQYRGQQMHEKKKQLLAEAQARYKARGQQ